MEYRDIRCSHSDSLPPLLAQLRLSVLISTYQTGHLVVVSAQDERLTVAFNQFERAMGIAVKPGTIAVCTRKEVWFLRNAPDIAAKLKGKHDACYLARTCHFTDDIEAHEAAWVAPGAGDRDEFWIVNTRYVTALAETDTPSGWRAVKHNGGCLIEVPSGHLLARSLSLPHSPRVEGNQIFFLHSGLGELAAVDARTGQITAVARLPGVSRGLAIHGGYAFVGLSKARPTLEGVPIVAERDKLRCGLWVVDLRTGTIAAQLEFQTGVEEIFDVQV